MPERENRLYLLLLPLAAFIVVVPLILNGCSCGHDFDFHILSWFEAASQFAHGNLHPHWAFTPAYSAGEPRFVFYPPVSWTIGAILGLIMPWTWTPIVYTWLALTGAGLALYYCARDFASRNAALLAATLYIVNPYTLFTAYERTAYAELLAAAWIPLLLHAILRERISIPRIAIPVALLWLTNAPAAVMSCYALALLAIIRITTNLIAPSMLRSSRSSGRNSAIQQAVHVIAGTLLGLGLAAFYIVPAAWERRYVQIKMAIIGDMRIKDNFLFRHTADPDHDQVLLTASIVALILIVATAVALLIADRTARSSKNRTPSSFASKSVIIPLVILSTAIVILLTPISAPVWRLAPEMRFLQFPWRLLAILATVMTIATAIALSSLRIKAAPVIALALTAALSAASYQVFNQSCDEPDTVQAQLALFHSNRGAEPTDEYTPVTADNDSLAHSNPGWWLTTDASASPPANSTPGPAPMHLALNLPSARTLILNLRNYPAWRITNNGNPITERDERNDGLIAIPVPTGKSNIAITYAHMPDETIGDTLTALSAVILLLLVTPKKPAFSEA